MTTEVQAVPTAMVTGSPERVPDIAIALKSEGFDILAAGPEVPTVPEGLSLGSIDCYVQLPAGPPQPDGRPLAPARAAIAGDVLARFDAAARLAPLLAPGAAVVLVADAAEDDVRDHQTRARRRLVTVLAEAILQDHGPSRVRTTVVDDGRAPEEIAALAWAEVRGPVPWSAYPHYETELAFADWRDEVFYLLGDR